MGLVRRLGIGIAEYEEQHEHFRDNGEDLVMFDSSLLLAP
jgi:hypothetical protein